MPKAYPKNWQRTLYICKDPTLREALWLPVAAGIQMRKNHITEETLEFFYMDGEGTAQQEPCGQSVSISLTGHRCRGDQAQDYILEELLESIENRTVAFLEADFSISGRPNARQGTAAVSITDYGSGEAQDRQTIGFVLHILGKTRPGTAVLRDGAVTFAPSV